MLIDQILGLRILFFALFFRTCLTQLRTVEDSQVHNEARFLAYLVKSEHSEKFYHGWTCGGAIISPLHIVTAAACVIDVDHLYAIVGYNKYVTAEALEDDSCTRKRKKRVIKTYAPKAYNVQLTGWTNHDIGVAVLDTPLDFMDSTYKIDCSYPPALIEVNFDPQYETPDLNVVAMGWGHLAKLRRLHHIQDNNETFLQESALQIVKREVCEKKFDHDPAMERVIENDIICVEGRGNSNSLTTNSPISSSTSATVTSTISATTNTATSAATSASTSAATKAATSAATSVTASATNITDHRKDNKFVDDYDDDAVYDDLLNKMDAKMAGRRDRSCRRHLNTRSLCQKDHGSPLIAWMGVKPIVIGVASTNLYNKSFDCVTPNLFTSTTKNKWFIKCTVKNDPDSLKTCDQILPREDLLMYEEDSDWSLRSNNRKTPQINPQLLPVLNLQKALSSYLQEYQSMHSDLPSGLLDYTTSNHESLGHPQQMLRMSQAQHIPHNELLQNRALSNYEKHLLNRQNNGIKQNIPNLLQNVLSYTKNQPNYDEVPNYQEIFTDRQQNIPNLQQSVPARQYIQPDYQQNVPNLPQSVPSHQYIQPEYQQNVPNYQQPGFNHQQNIPVYHRTDKPKFALMRMRAQKSLQEDLTTPRPQSFQMKIPAGQPKLSTLSNNYFRRRTISWRRHVGTNADLMDSISDELEMTSVSANKIKPLGSEIVIQFSV